MSSASSIREMSEKEMSQYLQACYKELISLRFNYAVSRSLQNPGRIRQLKRSVARVLTIQKEKSLSSLAQSSSNKKTKRKK